MRKLQKFGTLCLLLLFGWLGTSVESTLIAQERLAEPSCTEVPGGTVRTWNGSNWFHHQWKAGPFKPCVDVLCTPTGRNILRNSPSDHVHHHALMFALRVDDVNFWEESEPTFGKQLPISYRSEVEVGSTLPDHLRDILELNWTDAQGKIRLCERRTIETRASTPDCPATMLTWTSQLSLPTDVESVTLGGDHYYGLGLRFHSSMDRDGRFFSSEDAVSEPVRGDERLTRCRWMAYTAKLEGEPVTVAIFDTPENPAPMLAFTMGDAGGHFAYLAATTDLWRKPVRMTIDESSMTFRYGIVVQDGETSAKQMETLYQKWLSER